jgi:RNA polymerase sigma factor (sigma-70 family)
MRTLESLGEEKESSWSEMHPMIDHCAHAWPTKQVITAAQEGDPHAIAMLVEGSHIHVWRFAHTLCATQEDAEDAAQEALVILYRKIGTLRATAALASWMFQIVRHECLRRMRLQLQRPMSSADHECSAEDAALARLEVERIVECIASLPADQRAVLVLRDIQGVSGAVAASALGLNRATMKSRLHRARVAVRSQLSNGEQHEPKTGLRTRDI